MRSLRRMLVVGSFAATAVSPVAGQEPASPPMDLGAAVLLATHNDHGIDADLRKALLERDPRVRMVGGRAIAVVPHSELLPDLIGALAREQDRAAGAELLHDVLYLGGDRVIDIVEPQSRRLGFQAVGALAEWLGRMRPDRFIRTLPDLAATAGAAAWRLSPIVAMAAAQHGDLRDAIFTAWMPIAPEETWGDLLEIVFGPPPGIGATATVLGAALSSARPPVREETVWFLVNELAAKRSVPAELLNAALPGDFIGATEWEQFGRELVARRQKKAKTPDRTELLKREHSRRAARNLAGLPELTRSERGVLSETSGSAGRDFKWRSAAATGRTLPQIAPGVVGAVVAAAGCDVTTAQTAFAIVSFAPDGRPHQIQVDRPD